MYKAKKDNQKTDRLRSAKILTGSIEAGKELLNIIDSYDGIGPEDFSKDPSTQLIFNKNGSTTVRTLSK